MRFSATNNAFYGFLKIHFKNKLENKDEDEQDALSASAFARKKRAGKFSGLLSD